MGHYEQLDQHMCYGYALLQNAASLHDLKSADGRSLAEDYKQTVRACHEYKDIGMNFFVARKPLDGEL